MSIFKLIIHLIFYTFVGILCYHVYKYFQGGGSLASKFDHLFDIMENKAQKAVTPFANTLASKLDSIINSISNQINKLL